jgi:hypothetical protein
LFKSYLFGTLIVLRVQFSQIQSSALCPGIVVLNQLYQVLITKPPVDHRSVYLFLRSEQIFHVWKCTLSQIVALYQKTPIHVRTRLCDLV